MGVETLNIDEFPESPYMDEETPEDDSPQSYDGNGSKRSVSTSSSSGVVEFMEDNLEKEDYPTNGRRRTLLLLGLALLLVLAAIVTPIAVVASKKKKEQDTPANEMVDMNTGGEADSSPAEADNSEPEADNGGDNQGEGVATSDNNNNKDEEEEEELVNLFGMSSLPVAAFSKNIMEPYSTREALEQDLHAATTDMVRNILVQYSTVWEAQGLDTANEIGGTSSTNTNNKDDSDIATRGDANAHAKKIASNSRSVNQEANVDEADSVKEDGTFVYAAYGDHLVVWDRRGKQITQEPMPKPPMNQYGGFNSPWIQAVQLTEHHVLVFAGGYGVATPGGINFVQNETKLHVYTKPTVEEPFVTLVATDFINGHYLGSRYVEQTQTVQVVSGTDINTFLWLRVPLDPTNPVFYGLNRTDYVKHAARVAKDTIIPKFVTMLADEIIRSNRGELPNMLQVNDWSLHRQTGDWMNGMNPSSALDESLRAYIEVHSINPNDLPVDSFVEDNLKLSTTSFLGPQAHPFIRAAGDSMVISVARFDYNDQTEDANMTTFLLNLKIAPEGAGTSFESVGVLRGIPHDQYSIDIHGNDLRVVASTQKFNPFQDVHLCGMQQPPVQPSAWTGDECMTHDNWEVCYDLVVMQGCQELEKTGCPYAFTCAEGTATGESSTENVVVVFDMTGNEGEMVELGRARFGETHHGVGSVTFGPDYLYATTTFMKGPGPFYLIDLPAGQGPSVKSSFELEMVPTYLQSLNDDGTLVVGIGAIMEESNISYQDNVVLNVYDLSVPGQAKVVATKKINEDKMVTSSSTATYDPRAVQYTSEGLLFIPLSLVPDILAYYEAMDPTTGFSSMEQLGLDKLFEGFVVLDVSKAGEEEEGIKELFRVNHTSPIGSCHHCNGFLPNRRSFVYEESNSVMTMYNHLVASTDLSTLEQVWSFNVTIDNADMSCCF